MHTHHGELWALGIIVSCYAIFAMQLVVQTGFKALVKDKVSRAISALTLVFLLCAFSGYLPGILDMPSDVTLWSHRLLAVCAVWLVLSNQAGVVSAHLRGGVDD